MISENVYSQIAFQSQRIAHKMQISKLRQTEYWLYVFLPNLWQN